ncbi:MAG: hypothetical protein KDB88_09025 [Flavobacteriales bacterium]|nr:hypothetical protein [Flavobacteriales bacterium]
MEPEGARGYVRSVTRNGRALAAMIGACLAVLFSSPSGAQPDTLYVPSDDTTYAMAVVYDPPQDVEQYKRKGYFAFDTTRLAVILDHKRGKPSGVYRAFFPDGRPLIFAVYGYGSLHGDWTEYNEKGEITLKGQYRSGKREGVWTFRKERIVGHYRDGVPHGKWKYFDKDWRLIRVEKYHRGNAVKGNSYVFGPGTPDGGSQR